MNPAPLRSLSRRASGSLARKNACPARVIGKIVRRLSQNREQPYPEGMPELSRFFGIVIGIFYREHGRPHFHAVYGESEATIDIESGNVINSIVMFVKSGLKLRVIHSIDSY